MKLRDNTEYKELIGQISSIIERGRKRAAQAVNVQLLETYWEVGRYIVEFEQNGENRAEYGKALLEHLAADLSLSIGRGFSRSVTLPIFGLASVRFFKYKNSCFN